MTDAATQTAELADAAVQCEPLRGDAPEPAELQRQLASPALARFLRWAGPTCEVALQQNELADALRDEFAGKLHGGGLGSVEGLLHLLHQVRSI